MSNEETARAILDHSAAVERGAGTVYVCSVHCMLYSIDLTPNGWRASAWDGRGVAEVTGAAGALECVVMLLERGPVGRACLA